MDRIFLLGGNIQAKIASEAAIDPSRIQTFNQPGFAITDWELLTAAEQTTIVNDMAAIGCTASN